ncbi:MAG TPA: hypothetical protein VFL82_10935 [Thermomicrobiales bacterium]|nr:hypothetical protein [Thermomicrobiales bacterium]
MKRRRFAIHVAPLLLAMLLLLGTPLTGFGQTASTAAQPPTFAVAPAGQSDLSPIHLHAASGSSAEATLIVSNGGPTPIELKSFSVAVTTAVNGGYQVLPKGNGRFGQVDWISVPTATYTLAPGEQVARVVRLSVPKGTAPGEYMAALATETTKSEPVAGSEAFRQFIRKVNAIVITVPGPIHAHFELDAPAIAHGDSTTTITVPIANTGNVRVRPKGTITIERAKDQTIIKIPVALNSIYAWDTTMIQQTIGQVLPVGEYTLTIDLHDEATGATAKKTERVVFAPQLTATPGA